MIELRKLRKLLLDSLAAELEGRGFVYKARTQDYSKETPTARRDLHISFVNHKHDFDAVAYVGVQHRGLLDLLDRLMPTRSKQEKSQISYVGTELGYVATGTPYRWHVETTGDVIAVHSDVLLALDTHAFPFWERFSSVEEILSVTSGDDLTAQLYSPFDHIRAQTALAAAFLLGQKRAFNELIKSKTQLLEGKHPSELHVFLEFAEELATHWPKKAN
jgi:hypothetical protein